MKALTPGRIGSLTLRNRIVKTATYEGMSPGGRPSAELAAFHAGVARGGVGLSTVAYGAVEAAGRTFADQLLLDDGARDGLRRLTDAVHGAGGAASIQLAHCGGFTKCGSPRGPSWGLNRYGALLGRPLVRPLRPDDLARIEDAYAAATRLAFDCGFDAVEVHLGHGYLLSQWLSPLFHPRPLEERLIWPLRVLERVQVEARGPVLAKTNLEDGVPGGLGLEEALAIARAIAPRVDAIVPSAGLVMRNAMHLLRGSVPLADVIEVERHPLQKLALRLFGPFVLREQPFAPRFLQPGAEAVRGAVDVPVVLLGGIESRAAIEAATDAGFEFVALGRALLSDPDFVARLAAGEEVVARCDRCNRCMAEMDRDGVRCVLPAAAPG
jgi:2,4-dienoyl-CoA reductase-like NADH-dependent reductase (Old Yellow Enzyme family)